MYTEWNLDDGTGELSVSRCHAICQVPGTNYQVPTNPRYLVEQQLLKAGLRTAVVCSAPIRQQQQQQANHQAALEKQNTIHVWRED